MEMKSFLYKDLIDVSKFKDEGEKLRKNYNLMPQGIEIKYKKTRGKFNLESTTIPTQVPNSICIYSNPIYYVMHYKVKNKLEKRLGKRLYPTYYFERVYLNGQDLKKHIDRGACEVSVSLHVSSNIDRDWHIYFNHGDRIVSYKCDIGDAVVYNGVEIQHWREELRCQKNQYYHQIFFHYVDADGKYAHFAYDR